MSIKISNTEIFDKKIRARIAPMYKAFKEAVEAEKSAIVSRTQQGVDVDGSAFEPYAIKNPGKDWRDVRKRKGLQTTRVDLSFNGDMFKALKVSFKRDGFKFLASIFFNERKQSQKARGHHTGQLGKTKFEPRRFFGLSQRQQETIISKIRDAK